MHELSVALSLVDLACEKAEALGEVRVDAVCVRLGALSGVVREALVFCFAAAAEGTAIAGARLEIEEVPVTVFCPGCERARSIVGVQHLRCPDCGQPAFDLVAGRELELTALEVTDRAPYR